MTASRWVSALARVPAVPWVFSCSRRLTRSTTVVEAHALAAGERGDAERGSWVCLAGAAAADEDQGVGLLSELGAGQGLDEGALDNRLVPLEVIALAMEGGRAPRAVESAASGPGV